MVEYAQEEIASSLEYKSGAKVIPVDEDLSHHVTQGSLIPGGYYHIRIVPYYSTTRGIPSEAIRIRIRKPGTQVKVYQSFVCIYSKNF